LAAWNTSLIADGHLSRGVGILKQLAGKAIRATGILALLYVVLISTPLAWYFSAPLREATEQRRSDVIALFSSGQIDPTYATPDAAQRLLGALLLYRQGYAPVIVTSGSNRDVGAYQAETAATWLQRAGVPPSAIVIENRSQRTYESVVQLQRLMHERGWTSAVIVSSEMDIPRIRLVCERLGVKASYLGVPWIRPPWPGHLLYLSEGFPVFYHALYEYLALAFYRMKGWI
jgi:uncharacterized SAM-binding protein YcdF (DUF218 family)